MVRDPQNTEIVVTGANGLVGYEVLKTFAAEWSEFDIKAFVRREPDFTFPNVSYVSGSLPDEIPCNLFEKDNVILIHFASQLKAESLEEYRNINVTGTSKLLDSAGRKLSMIFYGSSMSVYGQGPFEKVSEKDPINPQTELAQTRREAEILVEMKCKELCIPGYLLRPRFIFGKRDRSTLPSLQKLSEKTFRIGTEKQSYSFINVDDYAKIISHLAQKTKIGECTSLNVAYKEAASLEDILDIFNPERDKSSFKIPIGFVMMLCGLSKKLLAVRTKLELIGQSQVMNTEKLYESASELVAQWESQSKLKNVVNEFMGVNSATEK
jgi:nucleoside-diphosphate-sugar epimerase